MLCQSKHVEFIYQEGTTDFLIVTFSPADMRANGKQFWGDLFFKKNGVSALGFVAKRQNWFPRESMEELMEAARPIFQQFKHICSYGSSMGAYGAIKYSGLIGAHTVAAFGPQFSIDPKYKEAAYTVFYKEELHQDVTIKAEDLGGNIFLFYDPRFRIDNYAAEFISSQGKVNRIPIPLVGHGVIRPFAKAKLGMEILQRCMAGDVDEVRSLTRIARRQDTIVRPTYLACFLAKKHIRWALQICDKYPEVLGDEIRLNKFCMAVQRGKQTAAAIVWAQQIFDQNPADLRGTKQLAAFLLAGGQFAAAKEAMERALLIEPDNYRSMLRMSKICAESKQDEEAIQWARKAVNTYPRDPETYRYLVMLLRDCGLHDEAGATLQEALLHHPKNSRFKSLMERWMPGESTASSGESQHDSDTPQLP